MADRVLPRRSSPLTARLWEYLGGVGDDVSSTSMSVPVIERVNVQLALDAYAAATDRFDVIGLQSDIGNYGGVSLPGLITGSWHGPGEAARQYISVDVDVDETIDCLRSGLVLTEFAGSPVVVLIYASQQRYPPEMVIEAVGVDQASADGFLRRFRELMHEHNAFRRKVVSSTFGMHGEFGLSFVKLPDVGRSDVVLAPGELEAIEAHYTNSALPDDGDEILRRLDGVAPAFIKELSRRAELVRLQGTDPSVSVLTTALDAMLEHATPVLRRTLAGPPEPNSDIKTRQ